MIYSDLAKTEHINSKNSQKYNKKCDKLEKRK